MVAEEEARSSEFKARTRAVTEKHLEKPMKKKASFG